MESGEEVGRVPVGREPVGAALSLDGRQLWVANRLPEGRADAGVVAAAVSVIDLETWTAAPPIRLPDGSTAEEHQDHPPPLYTDLRQHAVGTHNRSDRPEDRLDTPTLIEAWRTGPYLHDGSAATLLEVLTTRNPNDEHGTTSHLTERDLADLAAYVGSL